jgi:hypothetical protein
MSLIRDDSNNKLNVLDSYNIKKMNKVIKDSQKFYGPFLVKRCMSIYHLSKYNICVDILNKIIHYYVNDFYKKQYNAPLYRFITVSEKTIIANIIGNWFLECRYNPEYRYCRNMILRQYTQLFL